MDRGLDHPKNVHEVEEALNAWWIRKTNKMISGSNHTAGSIDSFTNSSGVTNGYKTPYRGKSNNNNNNNNNKTYNNAPVAAAITSSHASIYDKNKKNDSAHRQDDSEILRIGCVFTSRDTDHDDTSDSNETVASAIADEYHPGANDILFDSGASISITGQKHQLQEEELTDRIRITGFSGGHGVMSNKKGVLRLTPKLALNNVRHVSSCTYSLMSVGQVTKNGYSMVFTEEGAYLLPPRFFLNVDLARIKERSILTAEKIGNLYVRTISKKAETERRMEEERSFTYNPKGKSGKIPRKDEQKSDVISSSQPPSSVNNNMVSSVPSPPINSHTDNDTADNGDY
jgi:hypothetical protein